MKKRKRDDEFLPASQGGARKTRSKLELAPLVAGDHGSAEMDRAPTHPIHLMCPDELRRFVQGNSKKEVARHLKALTKEQIGDCCIKYPTFTLLFCKRLISKDQVEYCIEEDPLTAIVYAKELALTWEQSNQCLGLLNQITGGDREPKPWKTDSALVDICMRKEPGVTLKKLSRGAMSLPAETFEHCCLKAPTKALQYAPYKMHDELFRECARRNPWEAYKYAPDRLGIEELLRYACDHGYVIRNLLAEKPNSPIVKLLAPYLGRLDEDTAKVVARAFAADI